MTDPQSSVMQTLVCRMYFAASPGYMQMSLPNDMMVAPPGGHFLRTPSVCANTTLLCNSDLQRFKFEATRLICPKANKTQ